MSLFSSLKPSSSPLPEGDREHGESSPSESTSSVHSIVSASTPATEAGDTGAVEPQDKASKQDNIVPNVPFDSAASRTLFNAIDELKSFGATKFVAPPQLVIVGAQSVGKSSLLQSLTGIPFPVAADRCTRFPMRIVSRRTEPNSPDKITISIDPPDYELNEASDRDSVTIENYSKERQSLTATEFADIVKEVSEDYMKINPGQNFEHKNFAHEVLKIAVEGPKRSFFSILDIPGLISFGHDIRQDEKQEVENMIVQYMKRPENIIICAATASADLTSQPIFDLAKDHVDRNRLIGVFTKCDEISEKIPIMKVVDVVCGKVDSISQYLEHGWFVVKNMTKEEEEDNAGFDLDSAEQHLFGREPWSQVPKDRRGSGMLKRFLGNLLSEKIQDAFPVVLTEIQRQLLETKEQYKSLGPERSEHHQRRAYLSHLAQEYTNEAYKAVYSPWDLDSPDKWARKLMLDANVAFSKQMRESGHVYPFQYHDLDVQDYSQRINYLLSCKERDESGKLEIPLIEEEDRVEKAKSGKIMTKIKEEVALCSSTQLPGMVHPDVVHRLYKFQTTRWHEIAEQHIQEISRIILLTSETILSSVCPSSDGGSFLHDQLLLLIRKMHRNSLDNVRAVLKAYCDGNQNRLPQIHNPGYEELLHQLRSLRMVKTSIAASNITNSVTIKGNPQEMSSELLRQCHHSAIENVVDDVHDVLRAYFKFSLQSFIDHITCIVAENFAKDNAGALFGLSPDYVNNMETSEADRLGGEPKKVLQQRAHLQSKIKILESAEDVALNAQATARQQ
ncbi:hypothetical protein PWT90_01568 [Aphanocladium album]|nr:hypothetical protein PWT90_01568 [Aphanocladium album]